MILTIRTDKIEAEIGLFNNGGKKIGYKSWQAHRELSSTILEVIKELLESQKLDFKDINGVVFYKGLGSFTGLRIGASVANALQIPCVNENGKDWIENGVKKLQNGKAETAIPFYGSDAHTTTPKK